jgi:hypothetical protein
VPGHCGGGPGAQPTDARRHDAQRVTDRDLLWYDWSEIKNIPRV